MNERNVEALREILNEYGAHAYTYDKAEWLAMNGVLVPSALTDAEAQLFGCEPDDIEHTAPLGWPAVVPHLEAIAKGEPV